MTLPYEQEKAQEAAESLLKDLILEGARLPEIRWRAKMAIRHLMTSAEIRLLREASERQSQS